MSAETMEFLKAIENRLEDMVPEDMTPADADRRDGANGFPDEVAEIFKLNCSYCGKVTPHRFVKVDFEPLPKPKAGFRPAERNV